MSSSLSFTDFIVNGFTYTFDQKLETLIGPLPQLDKWNTDFDGVQHPDGVDLQAAMDYIGNTYVSQFFPQYTTGYRYIWNKSDGPTMEWHNDLVEGCNLFFLYYLTDVTEGGEVCFRVDGKETGCVQPKKHMLVMASQERHVEHKVNYTPQTRIVSNYGFNY